MMYPLMWDYRLDTNFKKQNILDRKKSPDLGLLLFKKL